ncbi:hepatocyte growth factor receptor-like [Crassostrea angulata]|uniref:hepatocyte growth factor receptor-like n=1 Tax=Magallana angulata TaxID=2784310 RepID=UPI0022B1100C|nr:hepatocyte growth factor receptor-like [Crassostrea angulata]
MSSRWCVLLLTLLLVLIPTLNAFYKTVSVPLKYAPLRRISVKPANGDIYIGGKNIVLRLDSNFDLLQNKTIGPQPDNKMCAPNQLVCDYKMTDNYVEVLEFIPRRRMVLVCGSVHQGLCTFLNSYHIDIEEKFYKDSFQNYIGSEKGTILIPFKTEDQSDDHYFIGRSWDGRRMEHTFPEFSFMEIYNRTNDPLQQWEFQNTTMYSSAGLCHHKRLNSATRFIFGFSTNEFIFSIYNQARTASNGTLFQTKISRICKNDKYMDSFNEVILECNQHNIATAAYYATTNETYVLYVAFSKSLNSTEALPNNSAAVCQFPQQDIDRMFNNLLKFCYINADAITPPDWSTCGETKACTKTNSQNYCSNRKAQKANPGIQRLTKPHYEPSGIVYQESHTIFTSIFAHQVNPRAIVVWIGTFDGYILKVNMEQQFRDRKPYVKYDLSQNRSQRIEPHHLSDHDTKHIVFLHGNKASTFPLFSCQVYTTCGTCLKTIDPLGCGWCNNSCSRKDECQFVWHDDSCPPLVYRVYSASSPMEGSTRLRIEGESFGDYPWSKVNVTIGEKNACNVMNKTRTSIECLTIAHDTRTVLVTVKATIGGVLKSSAVREFPILVTRPYLSYTYSLFGSRRGNTVLTLEGNNLDTGFSTKVLISDISCVITSKNQTHIEFKTRACWEIIQGKNMTCNECFPITVKINDDVITSSNDTFCYTNDPQIISVSRNTTIMSGGLKLVVRGTHFGNANSYSLNLRSMETSETIYTICELFNENLICPTPDLSKNIRRWETKLEMWIMIDDDDYYWKKWAGDAPHYMTVYPDPVFESFNTILRNDGSKVENHLLVYGQELNKVLQPQDISINFNIPVQAVSPTYLRCDLTEIDPKHYADDKKDVLTIKVGNVKAILGIKELKQHKGILREHLHSFPNELGIN